MNLQVVSRSALSDECEALVSDDAGRVSIPNCSWTFLKMTGARCDPLVAPLWTRLDLDRCRLVLDPQLAGWIPCPPKLWLMPGSSRERLIAPGSLRAWAGYFPLDTTPVSTCSGEAADDDRNDRHGHSTTAGLCVRWPLSALL